MTSMSPNPVRRSSIESFASAKSEILLDEDAFSNENSRELFEAIDQLRSCGANQDIELPELVIVGDQSVGKSSLLQGLTDIPFPVASGLCTRFPTRIVSRRTPARSGEMTKVSIEPKTFSAFGFADTQYIQRCEDYQSFSRTMPTMTSADFKDVIDQATELMSIKKSISDGMTSTEHEQRGDRNFSDDVLKIEISGPERSQFSILDVPGVFQSLTKDLTEKEKKGVTDMVQSYIVSKQSVIICVANGTNDLANQAIFDMVSKGDKNGERTVGVITKCDIAQDTSQVKKFHQGWFVVRNRTPSEVGEGIGSVERDSREHQFFSGPPWNGLPEERRGTQSLKKYLAELLCSRIKHSFPNFSREIQSLLNTTLNDLKLLATARKTIEEKRSYLTKIAQEFEKRASQSIRGRYDSMSANDPKLRMRVREANDAFALEMRVNGHSVPFKGETAQPYTNGMTSEAAANTGGKGVGGNQNIYPSNQHNKGNGSLFTSSNSVEDKPAPLAQPTGFSSSWNQTKQTQNQPALGQSVYPQQVKAPHFGENNSSTPGLLSTPTQIENPSLFSSSVPSKQTTHGLFGQRSAAPQSHSSITDSTKNVGMFGLPSQPKQMPERGLFGSLQNPSRPSRPDLAVRTPSSDPPREIYQWIREEIRASRGTELQGTLNTDVLPILFHKQALKWGKLAETHFLAVRQVTNESLVQMLHCICTDLLTEKRIKSLIFDANRQGEDRGLAHLSFRMDTILTKHLQTSNPAFEQKISEARKARFHAALERYRSTHHSRTNESPTDGSSSGNESIEGDEKLLVIDMRDTASLFTELHISNSQNLQDEVHDTLKAYYEIAREEFIEYVNQHVVEAYLDDPQGPVHSFDPLYVSGLSNEEIETLAAEDETLVRSRESKEQSVVRLNRAKGIAERYSR